MEWIKEERKIPVVADVDVLVAGGGVSGIAAAISAARLGAKVLLVERYGFLGGMATAGLVITVPPMNNGLQLEIAQRLQEMGGFSPLIGLNDYYSKNDVSAYTHAFDPELLKLLSIKMLKENGVNLLLHSLIVGTYVKDNSVCGVIVENKSGRQAIHARVIVDATGDADVAAFANVPYEKEKLENMLPVTLMFNLVGVNLKEFYKTGFKLDKIREVVEEGIKSGKLEFKLGTRQVKNTPGVYAEAVVHEGEINVWGGNLMGIDCTNAEDLTKAEIITREEVWKLYTFLKKEVPGFNSARIEYTATQVGVRETRRIVGEYTLTSEDIKAKKRFEDVIAKPYLHSTIAVPYRCLIPKKIDNLLVAGRCISVTSDALPPLRTIPACISTGQAAGSAAALSVLNNLKPRTIPITLLQETLAKQKVDLGLN
ncbi:MAG: FAD-dependent oxidoreductase [Nitrososphaeria archaeon]